MSSPCVACGGIGISSKGGTCGACGGAEVPEHLALIPALQPYEKALDGLAAQEAGARDLLAYCKGLLSDTAKKQLLSMVSKALADSSDRKAFIKQPLLNRIAYIDRRFSVLEQILGQCLEILNK